MYNDTKALVRAVVETKYAIFANFKEGDGIAEMNSLIDTLTYVLENRAIKV